MSVNPGSLNNQSKVTLKIGTEELSGFQGLQIVRSIDTIANGYSFSLPWDPTEKNKERFKPYAVRIISVWSDKTKLITGYIEKATFSTSADGKVLNIQGRSASGTLIDWSAGPPFQFENTTFNNLNKELYNNYDPSAGVGVAYTSPDTPPIPQITIEPGDTFERVISPIASAHGLWARPDADGRLEYLKISSTQKAIGALIEGTSPVKSITTDHDVTKRFSRYMAIGASEGEPETTAEVSDYEALGLAVRGRNIQEIKQQTTDINDAAKFARSRAIIDSYSCEVEVDGWHYNGHLWTPGEIITVQAPGAFIFKASRLIIISVAMKIDESGGQVSTLTLGIPEAFDGTEPKELPWVG